MPVTRRLLYSLAHPDDESFGQGGTIGRYVAEGAEVYYLCATNGDVGTVAPEMLNGYKSVAELRLAELEKASAILGFKKVYTLGYRDSGMMNSETSTDPACLWQAPREQVARRVVEVIREVKPQVVVTFNKYGGYGHPDHIAIQRATVDAFKLAGDPNYDTGQPAYQPQKLYYTSIAVNMFRLLVPYMRLRGIDPRKVGKNKDVDFLAILENAEPIHTKVNIRSYFDVWDRASACHASQLGGGPPRMPTLVRKFLAGMQGFTRVYPEPKANRVDEYDLFAGVQADD
jgi:mycothiol S-conjugate amidase